MFRTVVGRGKIGVFIVKTNVLGKKSGRWLGGGKISDSGTKHKVATKTNPYERYGEILFQKVASGYLLHFVQDGSSKNALENLCLCNNF